MSGAVADAEGDEDEKEKEEEEEMKRRRGREKRQLAQIAQRVTTLPPSLLLLTESQCCSHNQGRSSARIARTHRPNSASASNQATLLRHSVDQTTSKYNFETNISDLQVPCRQFVIMYIAFLLEHMHQSSFILTGPSTDQENF